MKSPNRQTPFVQPDRSIFLLLTHYRWQFAVVLSIFITLFEIYEHRESIPPITAAFAIEFGIFSILIPLLVGAILTLLALSEKKQQQAANNQIVFEKINRQLIAIDNWEEFCEVAVRFPFEIAPFTHSFFLFHNDDLLTDTFTILTSHQKREEEKISYPSELKISSHKQFLNDDIKKISADHFPTIHIPKGYSGYYLSFYTDYVCLAMLHLYLPASYQLREQEISDMTGLMPATFLGIIRLAPISANTVLGYEQERIKLARHLHDSVGQNLGFLLMKMDVFKNRIKSSQSLTLLNEMQQVANEAYEQVRLTLSSLQPENTQDLAATLYQVSILVASRQPGLDVQMMQEGNPVDLTLEVKQRLVSICREALTNVVKHAKATKIELIIHWQPTDLTVSIIDNGLGIQAKNDSFESFGLPMMFERAAEINATMKLKSRANQGLEVLIHLPLFDV